MQREYTIPSVPASPDARLALLAPLPAPGKPRPAIDSDRAISYARVSRSVQTSIPDQFKANLRNAARRGLVVDAELSDVASGLRADREGYQELLRLAGTNQYGHVLVYKADRLSRDDAEFITTVRKLLTMGMKVWDARIGEVTAHNVGQLAAQAYQESRNTADRTQDGMEERAAKGVKLGAPLLGYVHKTPPDVHHKYPETDDGRPDQYDVHPVIGPAISELFQRCARGESLGSLKRRFNATTGLKLTVWDIKCIMRNEYYKGLTAGCKMRASALDGRYSRPKEEWQLAFHDHRLTEPETWDKVQARLRVAKHVGQHREKQSRYALTGLLWCGRCQRRMHGRTMRETSKGYVCGVCGANKGLVKTERAARHMMQALPVSAEQVGALIGKDISADRERLTARLADYDAQLSKLSKRRSNLTVLRADGEITSQDYHAAIVATDRVRTELEHQREQAERELRTLPQDGALVQEALSRLRALPSLADAALMAPIEDQQAMYRACIKRVVLDPEAKTLTVEWLDHIAPYMKTGQQSIQV